MYYRTFYGKKITKCCPSDFFLSIEKTVGFYQLYVIKDWQN